MTYCVCGRPAYWVELDGRNREPIGDLCDDCLQDAILRGNTVMLLGDYERENNLRKSCYGG